MELLGYEEVGKVYKGCRSVDKKPVKDLKDLIIGLTEGSLENLVTKLGPNEGSEESVFYHSREGRGIKEKSSCTVNKKVGD